MKLKIFKLPRIESFMAIGEDCPWWAIEKNLSRLARSIQEQAREEALTNKLPFGGADVEFPRERRATVFLGGNPAYLKTPLSDEEIETFYNLLVEQFTKHGD